MAKIVEIPIAEGSEQEKRKAKPRKQAKSSNDSEFLSEKSQWDIINETGILSKVKKVETNQDEEEQAMLFQSIAFSIVLLFIFVLLQYSVHIQFHQSLELSLDNQILMVFLKKILAAIPVLFLIVYSSHRHSNKRWMQAVMFMVACVVGWKFPKQATYSLNQHIHSPLLGALWAYCLMQLHLPMAILSLVLVYITYKFQL